MSSTTNATSSAISIFPNNRQGHTQSHHHHSQTPSQTHSHSHQRRSTVTPTTTATTATKPLPMVGVGVGGVGVGIDIDYDMSMGMSMNMGMGMNMNMGMGIGASDLDMHMGSYHGIDMDIAMSSEDQQQQHLMSWSPRPTNSFQNRFYPAASPGSLFNPIAMPAPNISSSPIPINSRKSSNNAMTSAALAKLSKPNGAYKSGSSSERPRRTQPRRSKASDNIAERGADGSGNGDGEGEDSGNAEDGLDGSEEEDNPDVDRDSEAPNSLTVSAQGGNYICCGVTLPDLHALVDHFENAHVQVFASPSFEAMSGAGMGIPTAPSVVVQPSAPGNNAATTSPGSVSTFASVTSATATSTTSSSTTSSSASPYEFPAPPFDTDDMDISLSDDGPSPSPPLTPATTPSPTTSAFDPIRVVYHHHPAGVNMGMGGVGSAVGAGVGVAGYGMTSMRGAGATFTMGGYGMSAGSQYLSPTTVLSSSSSSAAATAAGGSAGMPLPYFRPSTYSSLAGGNGPIMNINHTPVAAAFNRYARYSDYSSQLPGTDPSPTYPYSTSTSVGKLHGGASSGSGSANGVYHHHHLGGNANGVNNGPAATAGYSAATASTASCLSPALLFSSSTEPSPLNTPSSSRTSSPVEGQRQTQQGHTSTLPKGTLPLHPSSSSSTSSGTAGTSTSIAPSRRTPPPSSLPSTATAAGSSSSSSNSHHPLSKPFKCPKPGCNKSYKQQNGLKYHLSHGQCNFAPRDPEVEKLSEQEREKRMRPFVCKVPVAVPSGGSAGGNGSAGSTSATAAGGGAANNVNGGAGNGVYVECGRRYKNMNGLRYHYQHTGEHGAIGLEMLAQGRHPLPDLPSGYTHSHSLSNSSPTSPLSRSNSKSGSTPTSPSTPNSIITTSISASTTPTTPTTTTASPSSSIVLPAINTSILTLPSASTSASSPTPILSASSPYPSPSPVLSVPATPVTPSPVSPQPHPHPLRISNSASALMLSSSSSSSSSLSMPPSPSRFGSGVSLAHGGPLGSGIGSGVGVGAGHVYGKSLSYPSSPVSSSAVQSPLQQGVQPHMPVPLHMMSQYYPYPMGQ